MAEIGKDIHRAKRLLDAGELVAVPTETVYGLAGNALDSSAVAKIFSAKDRPQFDPLIVHVHSIQQAEKITESIPEAARLLAKMFWPGPLTLVLPKKKIIPDLVTSGLDTVGVRSPDHPLTHHLLELLDFPLAAPSANPFGYVSPTLPEHVNEQLGDRISYILDGGPCRIGIESTILGFEGTEPVIYRLGGLSVEKIQSAIGKVTLKTGSLESPVAPGQLVSHYAPQKKLLLGNIQELLKTAGSSTAILSFSNYVSGIGQQYQSVLSPSGNLEEAAQQLFSALRHLDKLSVSVILAEEVPDVGIGRAINDRLRRASANHQ